MTSSVTMLLLGGLISLVSALATIYLQHRLSLQRLSAERRQHPFTVVYDKQTAFFDALAPLFLELNSYITTIDVWLGETTPEAPARVREAVDNSGSVQKLEALIDQYYMYLPEDSLRQVKDFHSKCFALTQAPSTQLTYEAIHELFALQNDIRQFVGIEKLSEDFLSAFAIRGKEEKIGARKREAS